MNVFLRKQVNACVCIGDLKLEEEASRSSRAAQIPRPLYTTHHVDVFGGILFSSPSSFSPLLFFFFLSHEVESEKISNISERMHVKDICTCSGICSVPLTICTRLCCSSLSQHPNFQSGKFLPLNLTTWLISLVGELDILSQR
jgi:hypothetical protein